MKRILLIALSLFSILFIAACSGEGVEDKEVEKEQVTKSATEVLEEAVANLKESNSYIEAHVMTERVTEEYIQTEVTFKNPNVVDEEGNYSPSFMTKYMAGFPYAVKTQGDMKESTPTRIVDSTMGISQEFLIMSPEEDPIPYSEDTELRDEVILNKEDVQFLLDTVAEEDEISDFGIYAYTGSDFNIKVLTNRLEGLKLREETIDNKEYYVIDATVKGHEEEWYLIFEEAEVEFWIEKDTNLLVKEVYRDKSEYEEDTGVGEEIFYYTYSKQFAFDEEESVMDRYNKIITYFPITESATDLMKTTKSDFTGLDLEEDEEELEVNDEVTEEVTEDSE